LFVEGGIYHVYNRFARGAAVFGEGDEAERFLETLRKVRDRDGLTVLAWVLMSNHYHMAMRAGPVALSRTMGYLQGRFGQSYNSRWRSTGPLWQSRYKARLVEDERYLYQLVAYIHLNPVVAKVVEDPAEYALSGHRELLGKAEPRLIAVDEVLSQYGDNLRAARRAYVRSLRAEREAAWVGEQPGGLPWWRREPDRPLDPEPPSAWIDELGRSTGLDRAPLGPREYLAAACGILNVNPARVAGAGQDREISRLRYLIAAVGIERWGMQAKALGNEIGRRPEVVTRWAARGAEERLEDVEFKEAYEGLDRGLAERASLQH
jgi:REP element-mobilizing transposase RayT